MFEHVLVAVDFSPASARLEGQLERLRALGCRRLTLVHVLVGGYTQAPELGHGPYYEERLEEMAARFRERGFEIDTAVCAGAVASELERVARERGAGVILAGSHGHSSLRDILLGSTVLDLSRRARRPLLLAPTGGDVALAEAPVCRPLLATDGSKAAAAAEEVFLQVLPQCRRGVVVAVGRWDDDPERVEERRTIEAHVEGLAQRAGERPCDTVLVGQGKPSVVIGRVAEEKAADLVVIGKRGRNPVTDLLLGSTAEAVCRQARRLTLLVPSS
ncbi:MULTISPECIES: universal stress protein [unclassified Thioalkalivibrio]|uniref:universal stress protein n=1 Tax=unclassified Thioalkalivibrio TaxID=2621013 RepID=UPI00036E2008|nr:MULTISPECIES: universal stress protein [unclassified Thioalkalivibrio]